MAKHYYLFTRRAGKASVASVERVYVEISDPDNPGTPEEATENFLNAQIEGRQRNRDKVKNQIRESIISVKLVRPSSWYQENGLGAHAPTGSAPAATKTRRKK